MIVHYDQEKKLNASSMRIVRRGGIIQLLFIDRDNIEILRHMTKGEYFLVISHDCCYDLCHDPSNSKGFKRWFSTVLFNGLFGHVNSLSIDYDTVELT